MVLIVAYRTRSNYTSGMKIFLALLLVSVSAFAEKRIVGVKAFDASVTNLTSAYRALAGSLAFTVPGHHISVQNTTATRVWVSYSAPGCASTNTDEMLVLTNNSNTHYHTYIPGAVCFKSGGAEITTGSLIVEIWE